MQSYTTVCQPDALDKLPIEKINSARSVLVQLFSATYERKEIEQAINEIESRFPFAHIIGTTTFGNIDNRAIHEGGINLTITAFSDTTLSLLHLKETTPVQSFDSGIYLTERLLRYNTQALILFTDHRSVDATSMLEGIDSLLENRNVAVAGGVAGYNRRKETFLISNTEISTHGIVAVALHSDTLRVGQHYKSDWTPFGKKLRITHAEGKRLYTIDHVPATELFAHYLGHDYIEHFHEARQLFPLLKVGSGVQTARTPLKMFADGSIEFAGEITSGAFYHIGFGNLEEILMNRNLPLSEIQTFAPASIFVYSCVARHRYLENSITQEITPLCSCTPLSGFFTCGEFYREGNRSYLLNQTMTILSMREHTKREEKPSCKLPHTQEERAFSTLKALSHLMMVTESETKEYYSYLEKRESLLCQGPVLHFKISLERPSGFRYISQNVHKILGYSAKELLNHEVTPAMLVDTETRRRLKRELLRFRHEKAHFYETKISVRSRYGNTRYLHLFIDMEKNDATERSHFIGYAIDITDQVRSEEKIRKLAFYDHITGLPNREMLKRTLEAKIADAKEKGELCAVTFFDLDKFKDVNDTYGHSVGDKLLQMIANRVRAVLKEDDFIARIGGDEFILIHSKLRRNSVQHHILATVNRIITIINEPFNIDGKIAHVSTSIGTAIYGIDGESVEDLIRHADMAMYEAKKDPSVHFKFYSHTMKLIRQEEMELKNALKEAVRKRHFTLLYQPQVDIETGEIVGAEALMRWKHPQRGEISPAVFIPLAEEMNLIIELGEWLLEEVCHKIAHLQRHTDISESFRTISVNISPLQFTDPYFITKVQRIVDLLQIDTRYLEFELTESILAENLGEMVEKMQRLKAMGITLSLDDFGTGYSSLQYLKELPIDTIKIDRSFITNLHENDTDQMLTSTIIQLSQNMQCKIVAEGVENLEQLAFLEKNNCKTYQGFYFSKPITFEALEQLIVSEKRRAEA